MMHTLQIGQYVDPAADAGEVLAELEVQQSRYQQVLAAAQELERVKAELLGVALQTAGGAGSCISGEARDGSRIVGTNGSATGCVGAFWAEVRDAEAALQVGGWAACLLCRTELSHDIWGK